MKYLLLLLLLPSPTATAADGTIQFKGAVVTNTCPVPDREETEECAGGDQVVHYSTEKVQVRTELTEYHGNLQTFTMTYE